jgi:hypothetical protein
LSYDGGAMRGVPEGGYPERTCEEVSGGGLIVEHGCHDNLMVQSRHYRQFHELKPGRREAGKLA